MARNELRRTCQNDMASGLNDSREQNTVRGNTICGGNLRVKKCGKNFDGVKRSRLEEECDQKTLDIRNELETEVNGVFEGGRREGKKGRRKEGGVSLKRAAGHSTPGHGLTVPDYSLSGHPSIFQGPRYQTQPITGRLARFSTSPMAGHSDTTALKKRRELR
ncbi:hypothetical protein BJX76DRAFT_298728 [Aspergillus varians]